MGSSVKPAAQPSKIASLGEQVTEARATENAGSVLLPGEAQVTGGSQIPEGGKLNIKGITVKDLTDKVVTLAPYFRINDLAAFKRIWQEDYEKFAHKEDCVHYAFCFTDDKRAHCREAYPNAEMVLQHLADVGAPLKAVLDGPAELERLEVHGPKVEVDKLRDALSPLGCLFYETEWGNRPAKPAMANDTVCHLYPYFKLKQPEEFRQIWYSAFPDTKANQEAEKSHQYAFSFCPRATLHLAVRAMPMLRAYCCT